MRLNVAPDASGSAGPVDELNSGLGDSSVPVDFDKVQEVILENFKSYEGQVRVGPFKKFTCVVGPNGAGKSNLMDAISFVLGVSTRHLRGQRLQDLVHRKDPETVAAAASRRCSVQLVYKDAGLKKTFKRVIQPAAEARFQIDGRGVSQEQYISSLEEINILSKARNFLVFQGDVEAAALRQGKELTGFLEQVSGSQALREEYEKLALEKASREDRARELYTRKRNAQNEKKRMSQQKEEAERYRTMEEEKRNLQAEFVLFRLCCTESSAQEIAESIQDARKELEEMQVAQKAVTAALEASEKRRAQVQLATGETERRLAAAKSRLEQVRPEHLQVRGELLAAQRRQEEILSHQEMDLERRRRLSEQAEALSAQVARLQEELRALNAARHEAPFSEEQWQRFREAQGEAERRTSAQCQEAKDLEQKLASARRLRAARQLDRREVQLQVRHLSQKVEDLTSSCSGLRSVHEHTAADAAKRRAEVEVLQEGRKQQGASRQKLEEERRKIMEEIQNITATERQIEHERRLTHICQDLGQLSGVQGRVLNLCQPVQKKYRVAVNVALGGYLDAVVSDTVQSARQCVQHLKDRMMAALTFLPLDNLRGAPDGRLLEELREQKGLRPALSCVSFEPRLGRAFDFMLADVVIADTLEEGRRFVFQRLKQRGLKCRVVTLNGETISRDGNLAVSSEARKGATRFDFSELEATQSRLQGIERQLMASKPSEEAWLAAEDEAKRAELKAQESQLQLQRAENELAVRQKELAAAEQNAAQLPPEDDQEEQSLKEQLATVEQRIGASGAELFAALDSELGASARQLEREARLAREAAQFREDALAREIAGFQAELAMVEQSLQEKRGRGLDEERQAELKSRQEELEKQVEALAREVQAQTEALQGQRELQQSQDQAVATSRRELKEKQQAATESERCLQNLGARLRRAREARLRLLCQSVLEDVDLPFLGSKKESQKALRRAATVAVGSEPSSELSLDVQLDYQHLPEARREAAGGPASKLLEEEYRGELRRLAGELEQLQPNLKAFEQLEQADQEAMAAEREVQRIRQKMEVAERSFQELRRQRREKFMGCFQKVQEEIQEVYRRLTRRAAAGFEGGSAFLDLEDLEDPWNGGVKFTAMPPSKRFCDITLLSGGEKTVAAMALLFALQAYQRPPFLVLDEIDAHLDHSNIQALANFISDLACQAIVISQKDRFFVHGEGLVGISKRKNTSVVFTMDVARLRKAAQREGEPLPLQ